MNILILGATGMLGNAMIRILSENADWGPESGRDFIYAIAAGLCTSPVVSQLPGSRRTGV